MANLEESEHHLYRTGSSEYQHLVLNHQVGKEIGNLRHSGGPVKAAHLPTVEVLDSHSNIYGSGAGAVANEIGKGALNELTHNHDRVVGEFLAGVVVGGAIVAALSPEIATVVAVSSLGLGAYELSQHAGDWIKAASEVAKPNGHSTKEIDEARANLQGLGAGAIDATAAAAGGAVSSYAMTSATNALARSGGESWNFGRPSAVPEIKSEFQTVLKSIAVMPKISGIHMLDQ